MDDAAAACILLTALLAGCATPAAPPTDGLPNGSPSMSAAWSWSSRATGDVAVRFTFLLDHEGSCDGSIGLASSNGTVGLRSVVLFDPDGATPMWFAAFSTGLIEAHAGGLVDTRKDDHGSEAFNGTWSLAVKHVLVVIMAANHLKPFDRDSPIGDDTLRLAFTCASQFHLVRTEVAHTLRLVGGLGAEGGIGVGVDLAGGFVLRDKAAINVEHGNSTAYAGFGASNLGQLALHGAAGEQSWDITSLEALAHLRQASGPAGPLQLDIDVEFNGGTWWAALFGFDPVASPDRIT